MNCKAIEESKEWDTAKLKAALDNRDDRIHGRIDAFEQRVTECLKTSPSLDLTSIQAEIEKLIYEVTTLAKTPAPPLPSLPTILAFIVDLFAVEKLPRVFEKRPYDETNTESDTEARTMKKEKRKPEEAR